MFSRSLNLRLTALFSGLFIAGALLLFALGYGLLHASLKQEETRALQSRLLELWAVYQTGGPDLLEKEVFLKTRVGENEAALIRVAAPPNRTLFLYLRDPRLYPVLRHLEQAYPPLPGTYRLRAEEGGLILAMASLRLADGNLLQIGLDTSGRERTLERYGNTFLLVMIPLLLVSFLGGLLFSARSLKPIKELLRTVRSILDTGRMSARLTPRGERDELDELVRYFNLMLEKIEALIAGMRDTLDNVAHDLRTPMTRLRVAAETALAAPRDAAGLREALSDCLEESTRILSLLTSLMELSEAETGVLKLNKESLDLAALLRDMAELFSYAAEEKGIVLAGDLPAELPVSADPDRLRQVFANLLDNAVKYTPPGGRVEIRAEQANGRARVTVTDTGIGISGEEIGSIWNRLYRGDRSRSQPGLGLGLSLVRAIVKAHGGEVEVSSVPDRGSRFTVSLPLPG